MAVYLGTYGRVTLKRKTSNGVKESVVNPSDVNVSRKRFSFDFDPGFLISGDQVEITSTNNATLAFVSTAGWSNGVKQSSGKWFIHVDELGGIRLYSTFGDALTGGSTNAIALDSIATDIPITVVVANAANRILGAITSYELNTSREMVDTTALSEQFRSQWSSLMSGSGRITCQWDYKDAYGGGNYETANYLLQLVLRTEVGSEFSAQMFLKTSGYNPNNTVTEADDQIYYQIDGVLTASALQFTPDSVVEMVADFVTTGPIRLLADVVTESKVLQENTDDILLEQDVTASLLQEAEG
jgi:hypothetical protein